MFKKIGILYEWLAFLSGIMLVQIGICTLTIWHNTPLENWLMLESLVSTIWFFWLTNIYLDDIGLQQSEIREVM